MNVNGVFDAPIPGQSLTQPVGGSPVEHPPRFVQLDDALNFVWDRLHRPKVLGKVIGMLQLGTPVEVLARQIIYQGLMSSMWNVDIALLMVQTVVWQIEAIAKLKKIKAKTRVEDVKHTDNILMLGHMLKQKEAQDNLLNPKKSEPTTPSFKGFF